MCFQVTGLDICPKYNSQSVASLGQKFTLISDRLMHVSHKLKCLKICKILFLIWINIPLYIDMNIMKWNYSY